MSALQTLRAVSAGLNNTQNEVSSGLRVANAADDVAYWSISTTMRSDNKAISSANDALGVGASKVDTAYAGTEAIVDILTDVKAALVTAKEDSVDKAQLQNQIKALSDQASGIVKSSSFSGINYLNTDGGDHINNVDAFDDLVVDSFTRDSKGATTVHTSKIDMRVTSMLNVDGGGILQKDDLDYYMPMGYMYSSNFYHEGHEDHYFSGPITFSNTDSVRTNILVDESEDAVGLSFNLTIDKSVVDDALGTTDGKIENVAQLRKVLQKAFDNAGASPYADVYGTQAIGSNDPYRYEIRTLETSGNLASSIAVGNVVTTFDPDLDDKDEINYNNYKLGLNTTSILNHDNLVPYGQMAFVSPFKVMVDATISFDLSIDNEALKTYVIDRPTVDAALGTTDGLINSADDFKKVVDYLVTIGAGLDVSTDGNLLTFKAEQDMYPGYGTYAVPFYISQFRPDPPFTLRFDLSEIDLESEDFTVDDYVEGVEFMLQQAIDSAAMLGSVQQRIDLADDFSRKMMDQIETGVGRLTDTDMEEASIRLQALQTQKELAVQSLQIANSNSQNILSLFN